MSGQIEGPPSRQPGGPRTQQQVRNFNIPVVKGAIFGSIAYIIGSTITLVIIMIAEGGSPNDIFGAAGTFYHNAQFVEIIGHSGVPLTDGSVNFLYQLDIPVIVLNAIPMIVLTCFGFLLARSANARTAGQGAKAGSTLAIGCIVLAVAISIYVSNDDATLPLVNSAVIVGIVYPALFGGVGGFLYAQ